MGPLIPVIVRLLRELLLARVARRVLRSRVVMVALLAVALWLASGLLFYAAEGGRVDVWEALYWALVTMSTVGYGDVVPSRGAGWLVAGFTIVAGITVYSLLVSTLADLFMEAGLRRALGLAPLKKKEIIVIGDAPECWDLVEELVANGLGDRVGWLLTKRPESEPPVEYMVGDPRRRADLVKAGVGSARVVALCLGDDSASLHVALAVRRVNRDARIVAAVRSPEAEELLREAGVSHVASGKILGRILASAVFEPWVAWLLEETSTTRGIMDLVEVAVSGGLVGRSVAEAEEELSARLGGRARILLLVKRGSSPVPLPRGDERLEEGDRIVALVARA